mgnify:CR=1 FL=1
MKRILIISDGKPGHLNQSIAFCKIKDVSYDILEVKFKSKFHKALSYLFDRFDFFTDFLFDDYKKYYFDFYDAVVSAGSGTYYFNKFIGQKYNKKSIRSNKKLASWCCFICIINCYNRASYIYIYKICKD